MGARRDRMGPDAGARARRQLRAMLTNGEPIDIVEVSLAVAAEEYPALDIERETARVRLISAEGARRVYTLSNPFARLDALRTYLFEELGFHGDHEDYNDPRNCYLNEVLERRLGIPVTLSILFMEVASAAGFDTRGISLPGHFIVGVRYDGRDLLVDPYHGGVIISEEDCRALVKRTTGRPSLFKRQLLDGTTSRQMLARLLLNLKHVYLEKPDYARALSVVERILLLSPNDATEIRDRGLLQAHLGRAGEAIVDLETYLTRTPGAPDADSVRGRVSWLRRRLSDLN